MAKGKYQEWLEPEGLLKIEGWARDGLTDKQIAKNIGISEQTLCVWKKSYSSLSESLKRGKEVVDRQVENALFKRATGCKCIELIEDYDPEADKLIVTRRITKEYPPDTTALIYWLKNRKPEQWRDKKDVGISGEMKLQNPFSNLSTEELRKLVDDG